MRGMVRIIARLEFAMATRQKWIRFFAVAFALLAMAAAYAAGAAEELRAPDGFARTTVTLIPLVLLLVPLAALLLGVSGQAREPGTEAFLFTQPVSRFEILFGKWLGQLAALSAALAIGFGSAGALLVASSGSRDLPRFLFFLLTTVLLGAAFLALAAAISARAPSRAAALALAAFAWFLFALLYDAAVLGVAGAISGRAGARLLFVSVFGNPADLGRVLTLSIAGTPHVLGAAGESWSRFLGGAAAATWLAGLALLAWIGVPLEIARRWTARRDL